jgi:hypothetical protein
MTEPDEIEIEALRNEFGRHKSIPEKYEAAILTALSKYPELKEVRINFVLKDRHSVPYGTAPTFASIFAEPADREYTISILEKAKAPMYYALIKNLTFEAKVGVFGHEISHVIQYNSLEKGELLKFLACYMIPEFQEKVEKAADMGAIIHGLGQELLEHAIYIRSIPGYAEERKAINRNYLKPEEIANYLQ